MQLDPAPRPSQPGLNQLGVMIAGIVQKDVDEPHIRIPRLDRHQQHDHAESVHRQHILDHGLAGFEIDRAMDVQAVSAAALFDRDGNVFRPPTANRPHLSVSLASAKLIETRDGVGGMNGRVAAIQAFSLSCCSTVSRQEPPSWPKVARPSMPFS